MIGESEKRSKQRARVAFKLNYLVMKVSEHIHANEKTCGATANVGRVSNAVILILIAMPNGETEIGKTNTQSQ